MKCSSAVALQALLAAGSASLGRGASTASPVEKVVNLLSELKERLTKDEIVEQQVYDKYACWCEKTTAKKAGSIEDASGELRMLGQGILSLKGGVATLVSEIEELVTAIAENQAAQAQATSLRQKGNAAYMAEQAEMKSVMVSLEQALKVLIEATNPVSSTSLLQASERAAAAVRSVIAALPAQATLAEGQVEKLDAFLQGGAHAKYMPQSFTVQGILVDMYKTFAKDLEATTLGEAGANRDFESYMDAKQVDLRGHEAEKAQREKDLADKESALADSQEIYDDTIAQKTADVSLFDATQESCRSKHDAWTKRSSARDEEIAGITQAIELLSCDDSRALFASAIKEGKEVRADASYDTGRDITPSFLQVRGTSAGSDEQPVKLAYDKLKQQARATHSFRLAALAVEVREAQVGHFDKVLTSIAAMITTLRDEAAADVAKRDQCKDEYQKIGSKVHNVTWLIEKNVAKINKLEGLLEMRQTQKAATIEDIAEVDRTTQMLVQTREAENGAFAAAKAEDQQAIDLLMKARTALSSYFQNHSAPCQGAATVAPPPASGRGPPPPQGGQSLSLVQTNWPWEQETGLVSQACNTVDNDYCLQAAPSWNSSYTCANSTDYCLTHAKDMRRCCPVACEAKPLCDMEACTALWSKGTCIYPVPTAPAAAFSAEGNRKHETNAIVVIMTMLLEDLNDEIRNGMKAEEQAQLEHEGQMEAARKLRADLVAKKVSLEGAIAKRGEEKADEEQDQTDNEGDLQSEHDYKATIQKDCDFIIRTFEKRAAARTAEMQGLVGAKEHLAGANQQSEAALLEKGRRPFDDMALSRTKFLGVR